MGCGDWVVKGCRRTVYGCNGVMDGSLGMEVRLVVDMMGRGIIPVLSLGFVFHVWVRMRPLGNLG